MCVQIGFIWLPPARYAHVGELTVVLGGVKCDTGALIDVCLSVVYFLASGHKEFPSPVKTVNSQQFCS